MLIGTDGTGGASGAADTLPLRPVAPGEGDLKVRSVMEPLLFVRCRPPRPTPPRVLLPITLVLLTEELEPRRIIRFVWRFPTGSNVGVCERRAAAAAAEESGPTLVDLVRKA